MSENRSQQPKVLVLGTGKVGRLVCRLLAETGDYQVTAADRSEEQASLAVHSRDGRTLENIQARAVDIANPESLRAALSGHDYVLSCAPYALNRPVAEAARDASVSYLDLTEDVATTKRVRELAQGSPGLFIPQCGLAPGFISIVAADLARQFSRVDTMKLRVGALPIYPSNRLKYNLSWSTEGLINEYGSPCEAVIDGRLTVTQPLEALESLSIDGIEYEAFNTSGGLGTLAESWAGKVNALDYKSIRYPGHRDLVAFLMKTLKFNDDRDTLKRVLERSIPYAWQDVVIIFVTAAGWTGDRYAQVSYVKKIYNRPIGGEHWSAIQITTASSACAVLDLVQEGKLPRSGFVRQEEVPFDAFIANRFGKAYA